MRHGYHARLAFSNSGNLVAFGTGSDACAEHEIGSRELQDALSNGYAGDDKLLAQLRAGQTVSQFPSVIERKRICKNLDRIQFIEVPGTEEQPPQAILGYVDGGTNLMYFKKELEFAHFASDADKDVSGAWCADSFAIRVRGKKYVKALKGFYEALKAGHVAFAGTFYRETFGSDRLNGVILADMRYLDDVSRANMAAAQTKYESELRLKARDDSRPLMHEMSKLAGPRWQHSFLHVSARWKNEVGGEVVYHLNPGREMKAQFGGPYTRQQLLDWAKAGYDTPLAPLATAEAA